MHHYTVKKSARYTATGAVTSGTFVAAPGATQRCRVTRVIVTKAGDCTARVHTTDVDGTAVTGPLLATSDEQQTVDVSVDTLGGPNKPILLSVSAACDVFIYYDQMQTNR